MRSGGLFGFHLFGLYTVCVPRLIRLSVRPGTVSILVVASFLAAPITVSANAAPESSATDPNYALVGLAQVDGVTYACLLDLKKNEHFVLSNKITHNGLRLVSVGPTNASVLSIVVRQGDTLVTLDLGKGSGTAMATAATSPQIPLPNESESLPPVPAGAHLPLLFRVSAAEVSLNDGQKAAVQQLRQDFIEQVKTDGSTGSLVKVWKQAQRRTDEEMRALLGDDLYSQYEMALNQGTAP